MRVPLVLALVSIVLTGCSPEPSLAVKTATVEEVVQRNLTYPESDYYQTKTGRPGGVLKISSTLDTATFDIHAVAHGNMQWLGRFLYDNLVYLDPSGKPTPWLAKSWTISPDGKVYTFKLREDVTFSDGSKFNAEAVRLNLDHMRSPDTRSQLAGIYIAPYDRGRVVDEFTFEAYLKTPYTPFLSVLAQSWLGMISPRSISENPKSIAESPVGSGPFTLKSYTRGESAVFERRADYHWAADYLRHEGPAYLDGIVLQFLPESAVRYSSLVAGQTQLTMDAPPQNAQELRANPAFHFSSRIRSGNPYRSLTFNTSKFPFDDQTVRKAVAVAIDRDAISQLLGFGEYVPKADFLAVNTRHYSDEFKNVLKYDPSLAKTLLADAGWREFDADGFRVKNGQRLGAEVLLADTTGVAGTVLVAAQSDLKKVGFDLRLKQIPATQATALRATNDYQAWGGGYWHTNTPDGLTILYHSKRIPTPAQSGQNISQLRDSALDEFLDTARETTDDSVAREAYRKAQGRLTELVPAVPLYESHHVAAWSQKVNGVFFDTSHNTPIIIGAWLEP